MAKKKTKKKTGRPSKYTPSMCDKLIAFFDVEPFTMVSVPHYEKTGKVDKDGKRVVVWVDQVRVVNVLPTMVGFARHTGISVRTLYDWMNPNHSSYHEEFSHTYTRTAKRLQKDFLLQCGLLGLHNPQYAKFAAINMTDMRDKKTEKVETGDRLSKLLEEISGQSKDIPKLNRERKQCENSL